MPVAITTELKKLLFEKYRGFADKRVKDLSRSNLFIVDDRHMGDQDAQGKLYLWFCQMFCEVIDRDSVKILMRGDVPKGTAVAHWFVEHGVDQSSASREFIIRRGEHSHLKELGAGFRAIVRVGAPRYSVKSYKFVCPRVAASLDQLAATLDGAWSS